MACANVGKAKKKKKYKMYGYIRGKRGWQRWCWWARIVFDMSRAAQEQGRGRGRGKTQLRETDIKTDAGRLHERTYVHVHIPEYMSVHLQKRFSGSLIASTIIIIIICDKRREGVFPLARSDLVPPFFRPPDSLISHSSMLHLQQEQPQSNNKRGKIANAIRNA